MKEAIKVQSVTIIIINGISESFQSAHWVRRKIEEIPVLGVSFLLGKNKAEESVCGRDGCEVGACIQVGRAVKRESEWGPGREVTGAGDTGGAEDGFPSGASEAARDQISAWASKQHASLGGCFSYWGTYVSPAKEVASSLLNHNQSSHHMPYAVLYHMPPGSNEKSHSCWKQSSESARKSRHVCRAGAGRDGAQHRGMLGEQKSMVSPDCGSQESILERWPSRSSS